MSSTAGKNALTKAMAGGTSQLSESQLKSAITEGVKVIERTQNKASKATAIAQTMGSHLVTTLEVQVGAFGSGMLYGLWGEKLKLGGKVDVRLVAATGLIGWGLWNVLKGKSGDHQMALANGAMAVMAGEAGAFAGQALRNRYNGVATLPGGLPGAGGQVPGLPAPAEGQVTILNGDLREVYQAHANQQANAIQAGTAINPFSERQAA